MCPLATHFVAWFVRLSDTSVSSAEMAEPIEMPFGVETHGGFRNLALDGGPDPQEEGVILGEQSSLVLTLL